jgi:hypothetical protein
MRYSNQERNNRNQELMRILTIRTNESRNEAWKEEYAWFESRKFRYEEFLEATTEIYLESDV